MLKLWRRMNTAIEKSGFDHYLHFLVGSAGTFTLFTVVPKEIGVAHLLIAGIVPSVIGLVKELTDMNFDWKDLIGYVAGSGIAMLMMWGGGYI